MTANQINYRANLEKERTNRAMEAETNRHNIAIEEIQRSNVDVSSRVADETARHNKVMEGLQGYASSLQAKMNEATAKHYELQDKIADTKVKLEDQRGRLTLLMNRGIESKKLDNQLKIAEIQSETSRYTAGINAETSDKNSQRQMYSSFVSSYVNRRNTVSSNRNKTLNNIINGVFRVLDS